MDLRHVRTVVTMADLRSLRKTAERIHLSPAAVHKHLGLMEESLGVPLFERNGRVLLPTQSLETLLPNLRGLLSDHDATVQTASELKGNKRGRVRIASGPAAANYLLPPLLEKFHKTYPGIEIQLETAPPNLMVDRLGSGALDVVLITGPFPHSDRVAEAASWSTAIVLVTALPDLPSRCQLKSLAEAPFILHPTGASFLGRLISDYFDRAGFAPKVMMHCENTDTIKAMLKRRMGVAMLPIWCLTDELGDKSLRVIHQKEAPLLANFTLLVRNTDLAPQAARALVEMAVAFPWKHMTRQS